MDEDDQEREKDSLLVKRLSRLSGLSPSPVDHLLNQSIFALNTEPEVNYHSSEESSEEEEQTSPDKVILPCTRR